MLMNLYMHISGCSYFLIEDSGVLVEEQNGIVRTNCIDCLDRTNVTQVYPEKKRKEKKIILTSFKRPKDL
jgi:hypothetical protein